MSKEFLITIDQGTTGSRVFLFDRQANIISSAYQEFTQHFPRPGWVEHDLEEIWSSLVQLIKQAVEKSGLDLKYAVGIGITNQRETTAIWEKRSGAPLGRAIVWQCRRTSELCDELKKKGLETMVQKKTGLVIDAYFSGTKIKWLLNHYEGSMNKAKNGELIFGTIDTYLLYKLTGGKEHKTDHTNASRTMIYNIHDKKWDQELCDLLEIPFSMLPEVQNTSSLFGKTKDLNVLPDGIPVYSMVGDQQSALFGQLCHQNGQVKNTYGTGCFMLMNTGAKCIESKNGLVSTIACDEKGSPVYALEGSVFIAGAVVQYLRDSLGFFKDAKDTESMAFSLEKDDEVVFVPAFAGLGAPYWDQKARGALFGLTRDTSMTQITRAALKSIALQSKDLLDSMLKDSGVNISSMKVDGGATANRYLMEYQASILGIPLVKPKNSETTVLGATYLAGLASKFWDSTKELEQLNPIETEFKPTMLDEEQVHREMKRWKNAISRILTSP